MRQDKNKNTMYNKYKISKFLSHHYLSLSSLFKSVLEGMDVRVVEGVNLLSQDAKRKYQEQ